MFFWDTRALYVRAKHDVISDVEWKAIQHAHTQEIITHLARMVMTVTIAFFSGMKEGIIGVPSGFSIWQVLSSGGAVWTLSPTEIENLVKGLLIEPEKFVRCTILVLSVAGILGGLKGVVSAVVDNFPALAHHGRGVWNPKAEAIRSYNQCEKTTFQHAVLLCIAPLEYFESIVRPIAPALPKWRVKFIPL